MSCLFTYLGGTSQSSRSTSSHNGSEDWTALCPASQVSQRVIDGSWEELWRVTSCLCGVLNRNVKLKKASATGGLRGDVRCCQKVNKKGRVHWPKLPPSRSPQSSRSTAPGFQGFSGLGCGSPVHYSLRPPCANTAQVLCKSSNPGDHDISTTNCSGISFHGIDHPLNNVTSVARVESSLHFPVSCRYTALRTANKQSNRIHHAVDNNHPIHLPPDLATNSTLQRLTSSSSSLGSFVILYYFLVVIPPLLLRSQQH